MKRAEKMLFLTLFLVAFVDAQIYPQPEQVHISLTSVSCHNTPVELSTELQTLSYIFDRIPMKCWSPG